MTRAQELKEYGEQELIEMVVELEDTLNEMQVLLDRTSRQAALNQVELDILCETRD